MEGFSPPRVKRDPDELLEARLQALEDELNRLSSRGDEAQIAALQQTVSELAQRLSQAEARIDAI